MPSNTRGFTLIEMALTVLVLSIVAAGAIGVIGPLRDGERAALTNQRLDVAQKAIALYAIQNGCLPCPAAPTANSTQGSPGRAVTGSGPFGSTYTSATVKCVATATACMSIVSDTGVLPWVELGIGEDDATDGWGNRLRYAVAGSGTGAPPCATGALQRTGAMLRVSGSSGCYPAGNLTVNNTDPPASSATNAAYVVFSNGADGALAHRTGTGGATGDRWTQSGGGGGQDENSDGDNTFVTGTVNDNTTTAHFDDLLRFGTTAVIIQMCGAGACGNPS